MRNRRRTVDSLRKKRLLARLEAEWQTLDDLVRAHPLSALRKPLIGAMSENRRVVDVIGHIAGWTRNAVKVAELQAHHPDALPSFPARALGITIAAFNRRQLERSSPSPTDEVLREHELAHRALTRAVARLSDRQLFGSHGPANWLTPALGHLRHHRDREIAPALEPTRRTSARKEEGSRGYRASSRVS